MMKIKLILWAWVVGTHGLAFGQIQASGSASLNQILDCGRYWALSYAEDSRGIIREYVHLYEKKKSEQPQKHIDLRKSAIRYRLYGEPRSLDPNDGATIYAPMDDREHVRMTSEGETFYIYSVHGAEKDHAAIECKEASHSIEGVTLYFDPGVVHFR